MCANITTCFVFVRSSLIIYTRNKESSQSLFKQQSVWSYVWSQDFTVCSAVNVAPLLLDLVTFQTFSDFFKGKHLETNQATFLTLKLMSGQVSFSWGQLLKFVSDCDALTVCVACEFSARVSCEWVGATNHLSQMFVPVNNFSFVFVKLKVKFNMTI